MTARELMNVLMDVAVHAPEKLDTPVFIYVEGQRRSVHSIDWAADLTDAVDINIEGKIV